MLSALEALLAEHIGLDANSIGHELFARAVQERRRSTGAADLGAYHALVTSSAPELQALIEAIVVSETWFFRDPEAFAALAREATGPWLLANPRGVLRLCSVPCATGEEPYSMGMALHDAGFPEARFLIDAIDISQRALAHARLAVYGSNAFRGKDLRFRDRYFEPVPRGFRLGERGRSGVTFRAGNLVGAELSEGAPYDAIFCRNVLIYLDASAQQRALAVLLQRLAPGGLLFVGPSETSLLEHQPLVPERIPLAFAFRKASAGSGARAASGPVRRALPRLVPRGRSHPGAALEPLQKQQLRRHSVPVPVPGPLDAETHLARISALADRGELKEASRRAIEHERSHGPSAQLFYLLGLLREAGGEPEAAAAYHRKALYLDPAHEEAMTHLALLLDKSGDVGGAERLRQRARRLTSAKEGR